MEYTMKQINSFKAFEKVRSSGIYNMYDQRAIEASGLTQEEYEFVKANYGDLKEASADYDAKKHLQNSVDHS